MFILSFLCINILIIYCADEEKEDDNQVITVCKASTTFSSDKVPRIFIAPDAFRNFSSFFENTPFYIAKEVVFIPTIYRSLLKSYPKIFFECPNSTLIDTYMRDILSNKLITNDIIRLSNQLLKIYALKNQNHLPLSFSLIYLYDQKILHETLFSFLSSINTPDPNKAKRHEWKVQTFIRAFSHLWENLQAQDESIQLNLALHQNISMVLGLSPLNYTAFFKYQYPALAKWIKVFTPNKSGKPLAAIFTLSLMHALTFKMHAPLDMQIVMQPQIQNTQENIPDLMPPLPQNSKKNSIEDPLSHKQTSFQAAILTPIPVRDHMPYKLARGKLKKFATENPSNPFSFSETNQNAFSNPLSTDFGDYFNSAQQYLVGQSLN